MLLLEPTTLVDDKITIKRFIVILVLHLIGVMLGQGSK